jgi:hypothetical protein
VIDLDGLIGAARLPERTYQLCLRGDLQAAYEQAQRDAAAVGAKDSLAATEASAAVVLAGLREQMREATVTLTMRALPRRQWQELLHQHPARPDDHFDMLAQYNRDTFFPAAIKACIVDPSMSDGQWEQMQHVITDGQFGALHEIVVALNMRPVSIPLS